MKLLYDNLLLDATLSATNNNESYPIGNVTHRFLEKKFMSTGTSSVITITFTEDKTVSAIALGFHNLTSGTYVLKNSSAATVGSGSLVIAYETDIVYFTPVSTVRIVELTVGSTDLLYIGGISAGAPLSFDFYNIDPRVDFYDKDSANFTRGGQMTGNRTANLFRYRGVLGTVSIAQKLSIETMLNSIGKTTPIYGDLFSGDHTISRPIYCRVVGDGALKRASKSNDFSYTVVMEEVR